MGVASVSHQSVRSVFGLIVRVLVLVAVATALLWAATNRPPPSRLTQQGYRELATTSQYGVFGTYPKLRRVVVEPVKKTYVSLAIDYAQTSFSHALVAGGDYECRTRTVCILSEFVRAEAGLPDRLRPQFVHALRHEYGHALVEDLLKIKFAGRRVGNELYPAFDEANKPRQTSQELTVISPVLKPVVKEWLNAPPTLYGLEHNTETLNEFVAESYARFMEGKSIPDATRRFLQSQSVPGKN